MLRVGTDCSGMEAPIQALVNLGILHTHKFSCDVDPLCGQTIGANFDPEMLLVGPACDIMRRDVAAVPSVDLYVCGFPCQPFSKLGGRRGFVDPRGSVFFGCLQYIRHHSPKYFVLENVKTLLTIDNGQTWRTIMSMLRAVPGYEVSHAVMNTKDYGIPQSRRRLYIVGMRDVERAFEFPPPIPLTCSPSDFVEEVEARVDQAVANEPRGSQRARALRLTPLLERRGATFVDVLQYRSGSRIPARGFPLATCILCTSYVWCVPKRRWATKEELLSLQGFPTSMHIPLPHHKFRKQIGNAMSVNILEHILAKMLLGTVGPNRGGPYQ